ncbi:MAG: LysR family transcriptional regulator [Archangium sp.]|nr:LysR family transcriptional regulator [Archangium sp.]
MISPADMVLFAAIVREGSFSEAARRQGITKQTASERIKNLETQLGVRLLERTTRRLRVTQIGATYFDRCATIAAEIDEANHEVQRQQAEPAGLLRLSSPTLYGRRYLAPVISKFLSRHPLVRIELVLANRRVDLLEEGIDVAIHLGPLDDSSLVSRSLGEGPLYFVASPGFLAKHGKPKATELEKTRCIGLSPFETWRVGDVKARLEPVLMVNDYEVACDAAVEGVGVARVPALVCAEAVRAGKLKMLFGPKPAMMRAISLVYPSRLNLPPKVRLFIDAMVALTEPRRP